MLYLAKVLHACDGELSRNKVVLVDDGCVKDIYSFVGETHSMILVDEIYISTVPTLKSVKDIMTISHLEKGERLYAYGLDEADALHRLD